MLLMYILWDNYKETKEALKTQKLETITAYETMSSVQLYNEQRFEELGKIKDRGWKNGKKHKAKL